MSSKDLITVVGGTGFLGRHIVASLMASGYRVRVASRRPEATRFHPSRSTPELATADVRDASSLRRALDGAAGVVNAVSLYAESGDLDFDSIHVRGAERLARIARESDVSRLIHISGIGVDLHSPSAYIRARAEGESRARTAFPDATVLRPSVLFGAGDDFLGTLDRVSRLPVIPLFGKGDTRLQPAHAADVATAVSLCFKRPEARSEVYELGGADRATYREILQALLACRGRRRLLIPFPFRLWHLLARLTSVLPGAPLTQDQVYLMEWDNVASPEHPGFPELGYRPTGILSGMEQVLNKDAGRFSQSAGHGPGR